MLPGCCAPAERITTGHQQQQLQQQEQGLGKEAGGLQVLLVLELQALPGTAGRTAAFVASGDTAGGAVELGARGSGRVARHWGSQGRSCPSCGGVAGV